MDLKREKLIESPQGKAAKERQSGNRAQVLGNFKDAIHKIAPPKKAKQEANKTSKSGWLAWLAEYISFPSEIRIEKLHTALFIC